MKVLFPHKSLIEIAAELYVKRVTPRQRRHKHGWTDRPTSGKAIDEERKGDRQTSGKAVYYGTSSNRRDNALAVADGYLRSVSRIAVLGAKTARGRLFVEIDKQLPLGDGPAGVPSIPIALHFATPRKVKHVHGH